METAPNLTCIYYDGLCPLCSREMDHYRRLPGSENLRFVDITAADFDAAKEGLDPFRVHRMMHVRTPDGQIKTAVDAFIAIWETFPQYRWMAKLARNPVLRPFLDLGYYLFARLRVYLPRTKRGGDCANSPYCEINRKS